MQLYCSFVECYNIFVTDLCKDVTLCRNTQELILNMVFNTLNVAALENSFRHVVL